MYCISFDTQEINEKKNIRQNLELFVANIIYPRCAAYLNENSFT